MLKVRSNILCDFDPKVKVIGQKAGICDGVPSTSALVVLIFSMLTVKRIKFITMFSRQISNKYQASQGKICPV